MENVKKTFPKGLLILAELAEFNKGEDVPPETAWIWGEEDEVSRCVAVNESTSTLYINNV